MHLVEANDTELNLEDIENPTIIEELIASFDWRTIAQEAIIIGIRLIFILLFFFIVYRVAKWGIETGFKRYVKKQDHVSNRYETIYRVVQNVFNTIFYFFLIYTVLEILSFPVGTLLASAGVVGLAISFGAQGFVSDLVNGFTILSGHQLDIGDEVEIEDVSGTVTNINLRTTQVKDFDGTMHFIPNREILVISNMSKGDMRALIDVRLFPDTDVTKVRQIIEKVHQEHLDDYPGITVPPSDILFVSNDKNQLTMRVIMYTKPGDQYGVMNGLYEVYIRELTNAGIELPFGDFDIDLS